MYRIRRIQQLLQSIDGCRFETDIRGPRAIGQKAPIIETEHHVDRCIHRTTAHMGARKCQFIRRVREFAVQGVQGQVLIAHAFASHMASKSRTSGGSADLPFPSRAARYYLDRVSRFRCRDSKPVNEIATALERAGFKPDVQRSVSRREDPADGASAGRSLELTAADRQGLGIVPIPNVPITIHRDVSGTDVIWGCPLHRPGNLKMLKGPAPGFRGVRRYQGIPAQFVHGEACVLNSWEHSGQSNVLHMRVCTEFQAVETHRDPAFDRSAKCQRKKIRYDQPTVVDTKAASAG